MIQPRGVTCDFLGVIFEKKFGEKSSSVMQKLGIF